MNRRWIMAAAAAVIAAPLLAGCGDRPDPDEVARALEHRLRTEALEAGARRIDPGGAVRRIDPGRIQVIDLEIENSQFVTDYWSLATRFTLEYGSGTDRYAARIRIARAGGTWAVRGVTGLRSADPLR